MSQKETKPQNVQTSSDKKIIELKEVKPQTQGNTFEGSQKANTVSATPVSQVSDNPFASIMAPKPVAQVSPATAEVPTSPSVTPPTPKPSNPTPVVSSDTKQDKPK